MHFPIRIPKKCNLFKAAENGNIKFFTRNSKNIPIEFHKEIMNLSVKNGHLHLVIWLHENKIIYGKKAMDLAATHGHIDILEFFHKNSENGCSRNAMDCAAKNGYFDIVKFLHFNRTEGCTTNAIDYAAKNGYFDIVKFLYLYRKEGYINAINLVDSEISKWIKEQNIIKELISLWERCT